MCINGAWLLLDNWCSIFLTVIMLYFDERSLKSSGRLNDMKIVIAALHC